MRPRATLALALSLAAAGAARGQDVAVPSEEIPLALSLLLAAAGAARGQDVAVPSEEIPLAPETAAESALPRDRILAVVGENLLLESEWRDQVEVLAGQLEVDPGSPQMRDLAVETFQQMISDLVVLAAAERDTAIQVDSERVVEETDEEVARIRERFPSEAEFLRQLTQSQWGSLAGYRADIMERKRRELLGQAYLDLHRAEIVARPVSDDEVRAFWEENRESFGRTPQTVRFEEIPVLLEPTEDVRAAALAESQEVLADIRAGTVDFATAAREHSDDPASSQNGGDVGWFGRGRMVEPFERAAFDSPVGELVGPVETVFGYHVLQVLDKRGDEVRVRHVLFSFVRSDEASAAARARADELAAAVNGGADVDSLQAAWMPGDSVSASVIELGRSQLPPPYARGLEGLAPGAAAVIETPTGFSVIVYRGTGGGEAVTYEEIAPRLRSQLEQQRAEEEFVQRLRDRVYVDVRIPPERVLQGA